jgi:hypothetical protein
MKPLEGDCPREYVNGRDITGMNLPKLFKRLETRKRPFIVERAFLGILQLYYNGLVDGFGPTCHSSSRNIMGKLDLLSKLLATGTKCVGRFYREGVPYDPIREEVLPYTKDIIRWGSNENVGFYHLNTSPKEVFRFGQLAPENIQHSPEVIVPVATEGFEPALLLASIYEDVDIFPVRYSKCRKNDVQVKIPKGMFRSGVSKKIKNKKVVALEGTVSSGDSFGKVIRFIKEFEPSSFEAGTVIGKLGMKALSEEGVKSYRGNNKFGSVCLDQRV